MRKGRVTTDPKESTLHLRLNDFQKRMLEEKSNKQGISMSQYIRNLIDKDIRLS